MGGTGYDDSACSFTSIKQLKEPESTNARMEVRS